MHKKKGPAVPYETVTVIDGTEYIVHTVFDPNATETAYDKIGRLILNNIGSITTDKVA